MEKPGKTLTFLLTLVTLIIAAALAGFLLLFTQLKPAGWAALAVAIGCVAGALVQRRADLTKPEAQRDAERTQREIDATIAAMVVVAEADGSLRPERAERIRDKAHELFGAPASAEAMTAMAAKTGDIIPWLATRAYELSSASRIRLLRACEAIAADPEDNGPPMAERLVAVEAAMRRVD